MHQAKKESNRRMDIHADLLTYGLIWRNAIFCINANVLDNDQWRNKLNQILAVKIDPTYDPISIVPTLLIL